MRHLRVSKALVSGSISKRHFKMSRLSRSTRSAESTRVNGKTTCVRAEVLKYIRTGTFTSVNTRTTADMAKETYTKSQLVKHSRENGIRA